MNSEIQAYNDQQLESDRAICNLLAQTIYSELPEAESKVWHAHPVWFLDGNPIVGYSKLKHSVRLLFWSGQSFEEPQLKSEGKFKAAEKAYLLVEDVDLDSEVDPKIRTSDKVVTLNTCQNHETNQKSIQRGLQSQGSY